MEFAYSMEWSEDHPLLLIGGGERSQVGHLLAERVTYRRWQRRSFTRP
jgi:hypothetical protein